MHEWLGNVVLEMTRICDEFKEVKVVFGREVLNVISAYAPHVRVEGTLKGLRWCDSKYLYISKFVC